MEFQGRRRAASAAATTLGGDRPPLDLQFYRAPPSGPMSLREFEALAAERVRVLRALAAASASGAKPYGEEWRKAALDRLKRDGLKEALRSCQRTSGPKGGSEVEWLARRRDRIGHFALRLVYCRSEELRRWYVSRELELFRLRFSALSPAEIVLFLESENLRYEPMSAAEKAAVEDRLRESTPSRSGSKVDSADFYKVKFVEVLDLVRNRRVFIKDGYAHVPGEELASALASRFRAHLSGSLAAAVAKLPKLEADERLLPILKGAHDSYSGDTYDASDSALPLESIDAASVESFPPCMRRLHETLRSAHHLKHGGRLQYGLFLKAAGLNMDDALKFWRGEFTKIMEPDKFEKTYAYSVRYNYGKEGSKKNYSAYSCPKIITGNVGPGDSHGCPFKHSDPNVLKNELLTYGFPPQEVFEIGELAKKGHYQIACGKCFDIKHNTKLELGINHPNHYFIESRNVLSGNIKQPDRSQSDNSQATQTSSQ